MSSGNLQCLWRDGMQQLQHWLCMPRWLDDCNACWRHLPCRHVQRIWGDGVQQLQRRLRVSDGRVNERHGGDVWRRFVQRRRRVCV
jgi:hypothetical protein